MDAVIRSPVSASKKESCAANGAADGGLCGQRSGGGARAVEFVKGQEKGAASAMITADPRLLEAIETTLQVANSTASVLICGESGTGKELLARAAHEYSGRAQGPFVAVNSAAIPEQLLESDLFGHEKGSFTGAEKRRMGRFERACGGTLFLDEIGDMSTALQAKILRVLEAREIERVGGTETIPVDVRVIAASNRCLPLDIEMGRFRDDLYYRLAVVVIHLPSLRDRRDDILLLARHFLAGFAARNGRTAPDLSEEAADHLLRYRWPGNVRELRNAMERAVLLAGERVLPQHLPPGVATRILPTAVQALACDDNWMALQDVERRHIARVMELVAGNQSRAAEILRIHRNTLRTKLRRYGLG